MVFKVKFSVVRGAADANRADITITYMSQRWVLERGLGKD